MAAQRITSTVTDFSAESTPAARVPGIDGLRGIAVAAMFFTHSARVVGPALGRAPDLHAWLRFVEPGISACFLYLVGWSLSSSWSNRGRPGRAAWYRRALRRALALYACAVALFALQHGPHVPDLVLSPDILSVIAWAIVVIGACLWAWPWGLAWLAAGVLTLAVALSAGEITCSGLNAGPGGAIPLLAFALFGAGLEQAGSRGRTLIVLALGVCTLIGLGPLRQAPLVEQVASTYATPSGATASVWFWNHTTRAVLVLAGPLAALVLAAARLPRWRWAGPLELLGRHALVAYVGHLLVLGVVDRYWVLPSGSGPLVLCGAALVGVALAVALALESRAFARWRKLLHREVGLAL